MLGDNRRGTMVEGGKTSTMEDAVALNIKDEETHRLARELAGLTEQTLTKAVRDALRAAVERQRAAVGRARDTLVDDLDAIALHCASLPVVDHRDADAILGYDERGLPA